MLNYFVDSYLWCFFFNHNAGNVGSSYVNVNRNKGREQRKKINYISLNLLFFINKTKQQLFVANLKPEFALVSLLMFPGTSSVVSKDVTLSQLLLCLSYVLPPKVLTQSRQLFLILVHKSAVSSIFKCKGPIDQNFGKISDLKCLVLNPRKPEIHCNCLKSLIVKIQMLCEVVNNGLKEHLLCIFAQSLGSLCNITFQVVLLNATSPM